MSTTLYLLVSRAEEDGAVRLRLGGGRHTTTTQPARVFEDRRQAEEGLRYAAPFIAGGKKWVPEVIEVTV